MVNLHKQDLGMTSVTIYSVADRMMELYYLQKGKILSYGKLEMILVTIWLYSLEIDGKAIFPMKWKISYGRVMPLNESVERRVRALRRNWVHGTPSAMPREQWNLISSICNGDKNILNNKQKELMPKIIDHLNSIEFKNDDVLTADAYLKAARVKKEKDAKLSILDRIIEWFYIYGNETVVSLMVLLGIFCSLLLFCSVLRLR